MQSINMWCKCSDAGITPFDELDFETMDLLNEITPGSPPTFNIVNSSTFIQEITKNGSSASRNRMLPPYFLLSLSYQPHVNTVLNLLSVKRTTALKGQERTSTLNEYLNDESALNNSQATQYSMEEPPLSDHGVDIFASLVLSTGILYLQPSLDRYYPMWSDVEANKQHSVVFMVSNGSISSCVDGAFVENNPNLVLWDSDVGLNEEQPISVSFSEHLYSVQKLVSECFV